MKPEEVAEFTRLLEAAQQPTSLYRDHARAHFALSEFVTAHAADFLAALQPREDMREHFAKIAEEAKVAVEFNGKPNPYLDHIDEANNAACDAIAAAIRACDHPVAALQGPQEERERCAKIVEEYGPSCFGEAPYFNGGYMQRVLNRLAARIRAEAAHGGTPRP